MNDNLAAESEGSRHFHIHSAERWAECVMPVVAADIDPRTMIEWGRIANISPATLRGRCRAAGVRPKAALDFARLLRAVVKSGGMEPHFALDVLHERALRRMLVAGGLADLSGNSITYQGYLMRQRLVMSRHALEAVGRLVGDRIDQLR